VSLRAAVFQYDHTGTDAGLRLSRHEASAALVPKRTILVPSGDTFTDFLLVVKDFRVYRLMYDQRTFSPTQLHDQPIMLPCPVAQSVYRAPQPICMVSLSFFHTDYVISLSCSLFQSHDQFIILPIPATWLAYHIFRANYMISLSCFPCKLHDQPIIFPFSSRTISLSCSPSLLHG